jgi:peptidoglycan hydrolase-like protein with peptidoglycan-binding domain
MPQFDVGNDDRARQFLLANGFSADDIRNLSKRGGLSHGELGALDAKLQAIPQAKIDQLTTQHLSRLIEGVDKVIDQVREQNPSAADAIAKDPKLQLSIADYENQFGSAGHQLVGFLAGKPERLQGGTVQAGNPPTRDDLLTFVHNTKYGQDPHNAKAIESRNERFDKAMGELHLGPVTQTHPHVPNTTSLLEQGARGTAVRTLQTDLAKLGYGDGLGHPLKADGDFGIRTRHVVERFQHDHHLTVDGKVGPLTLQALHTALREQAPTHDLTHTSHPDHALFEQALAGVRTLDAQHGRVPDQHSLNLAAALTIEAKREGLTRIDHVALSEDASRVIAIQQSGSPTALLPRFATVETMAAMQTPMAESAVRATSVPSPAEQSPPAQVHTPTQAPTLSI